jgi:hypothetical protein
MDLVLQRAISLKIEELSLIEASRQQNQIAVPGSIAICTTFCKSDFLSYHNFQEESDFTTLYLGGSYESSAFLLPISFSNAAPNKVVSHLGSPYAGLCINSDQPLKIRGAYELCFDWIIQKFHSISSLEIRLPPSVVSQSTPIHEWALWSLGFTPSVMYLGRYFTPRNELRFNRNRRRRIDKIDRSNMKIEFSKIPSPEVYGLLAENRKKRHSVIPTHTLGDLRQIEDCVPGTLKTFSVRHFSNICAVAIVFEDTKFATIQYLAGNDCSFECGSQDVLVQELVKNFKSSNKVLLFGTSTEPNQNHQTVNSGLDTYKESFGAIPYVASRLTKVWN